MYGGHYQWLFQITKKNHHQTDKNPSLLFLSPSHTKNAPSTLPPQVLESKGALLDDTHLYTEALSSKPPDGPEIGFAGTALAGTRRPSPPPCTLSSSGTGGVIEGSSPLSPFTIDGGVADPVEMDCPSCTATNDISGGCVTKCHVCGLDLFT